MVYLGNAFSIQMLNRDCCVSFSKLTLDETKDFLNHNNFISIVGHPDTATFLASLLGVDIPCNRTSITLNQDDVLVVAQYVGGRLNGDITLDPSMFAFYLVRILT